MTEDKGKFYIIDRGVKNGHNYVIFEKDGGYFGIILHDEVELKSSKEEVYDWLEKETSRNDYCVGFLGYVPKCKGYLRKGKDPLTYTGISLGNEF